MMNLIEIKNLKAYFEKNGKISKAVDDVSFALKKGEILGLVGESGCGKSVTALSILRLIREPGNIVGGEIVFEEHDLLTLDSDKMRAIRGNQIAMIFQEPMTSLNPVFTCGDQVSEALLAHKNITDGEARSQTIELFREVGLADPERTFKTYPHELSGGMRQRVMIAMALACGPSVLIADEPTTALDVTVQAQILELIKQFQKERGMSVILITHDFGVVAEMCDRVAVMYASKIVESADVKTIFKNPRHPYTVGLLNSIPKIDSVQQTLSTIPGIVPDASHYPVGCHFHRRCSLATERCKNEKPDLIEIESGHTVACWEWENVIHTRER
ncbi:ABC transporter ATP-binding protein [bacterium]|nr:ABC transporter ATP-binding protein [bacterium]